MQRTIKGPSDRVATRYIPQGFIEQVHADADAVVYLSPEGQPRALGYVGTAGKPAFNYRFNSEAHRASYLTTWLTNQRACAARRAERKEERKTAVHTLVVGDIVYSTWGYEQTNVDFYQVVRVVSDKTVQVRQIAKETEETGFMSGKALPLKDQFLDDSAAVSRRAIGARVQKVDRDNGASKWDGKPVSCSWGH